MILGGLRVSWMSDGVGVVLLVLVLGAACAWVVDTDGGSVSVLLLGVRPDAGRLWAVVGAKGWPSCWC